jgi:hypothetical protein
VRKITGPTTANTNTHQRPPGFKPADHADAGPGRILKGLLSASRSQSLALKNEPVAAAVKTQLDKAFADNGQILAKIQTVIDNPSATFTLGSAAGQTITIGAADLALLDRLALSMLQALATQPAAVARLAGDARQRMHVGRRGGGRRRLAGKTTSAITTRRPGRLPAPHARTSSASWPPA